VFLLTLVLIITYGAVRIKTDNKKLGSILFISGFIVSAYSSVPLLITLPLLFVSLLALNILTFRDFRYLIIVLFLLILPLVFLIHKNPVGFKNTFNNDIQIFSDPSLLNTINRYQGAAEKTGFKILGRVSENKYLFYSEYFGLKYMSQFIPENFFTSQSKLLGFSFEPPVLLGFIIPFVYGSYWLLKNSNTRNIFLISSLLAIPSVLANDFISLNRLVLFSPVVVFIISSGFIHLYNQKDGKCARVFLATTAILVLFQLFVTVNDIKMRELQRFERYYGQKYELAEP